MGVHEALSSYAYKAAVVRDLKKEMYQHLTRQHDKRTISDFSDQITRNVRARSSLLVSSVESFSIGKIIPGAEVRY